MHVVETPFPGQTYKAHVNPGCPGELKTHGTASVVNGKDIVFERWVDMPDGVHVAACLLEGRQTYFAPSEIVSE